MQTIAGSVQIRVRLPRGGVHLRQNLVSRQRIGAAAQAKGTQKRASAAKRIPTGVQGNAARAFFGAYLTNWLFDRKYSK